VAQFRVDWLAIYALEKMDHNHAAFSSPNSLTVMLFKIHYTSFSNQCSAVRVILPLFLRGIYPPRRSALIGEVYVGWADRSTEGKKFRIGHCPMGNDPEIFSWEMPAGTVYFW
jgi:hypothetical protein